MGQRPTEVGGEDDPKAIRADIEQTRVDLSETIDAIQEKINPDVLKEQAKDALRDATVGRATETMENAVASAEEAAYAASDAVMEVSETLMDTIKGNPIPSLLAGLGLGWLFMNRTPARRTGRNYYRGNGDGNYRGRRDEERYGEYRYLGQRQASGEGLGDVAERAGEVAGRAQERAGEMVGDAREAAQQAGSTVGDLVRQNPIPSALVGLGLGWLAMNSGGSSRPNRDYETDYSYSYQRRPGYAKHEQAGNIGERAAGIVGGAMNQAQSTVGQVADQAQSTVGQVADQAQSTVGQVIDQAQSTVGQVADQAQSTVGQVVDQAQSAAGQVADQAQAAAGQVQETVSDLAYATRRQAGRVEDKFQELLHANPLAVGAAAIAVGALLGAAAPSTQREQELMGETRDNFMEQARGKAEEVAEKVQRVTESAAEEVQHQARAEGLTKA